MPPPGGPQGDVKTVLLVKMYHGKKMKRIVVEQWYRDHQSPYHTVTAKPHPDKPFSIHDVDHWVVEGAPMVLPFQDVFLRPAQGQEETDLVLTEDFFATMAMQCWQTATDI